MNVLFFIEPWINYHAPYLRNNWVDGDFSLLCDCVNQFREKSRCFFLIGDPQTSTAERVLRDAHRADYAVIHQKELRRLFPNDLSAALAWYNDNAPDKAKEGMKSLVLEKLDGFEPDVIIVPFTSVPYLRELFPRALVLHGDMGCFARQPFPVTYTLDPCGILKNSYLGKHTKEILSKPLEEEDRQFLKAFRDFFLEKHLIPHNPFTREQLTEGRSFRHLLLLPLNLSKSFSFEGNSPYIDQWELLTHVFDSVPPDIGVIVTEHRDYECVLSPPIDDYLRRTYPNYIHLEEFNLYPMCSQFLLHHADAIASVSSSLCYQALLWEKPVCALGKCHINAMADIEDIADLDSYLRLGKYRPKESLLYFLLTRLNIPVQDYLRNPAWLEKRIKGWIEHKDANGPEEDFFPLLDDPERLLENYKQRARPEIQANRPPCLIRPSGV